jgi:transposase
VCTCRGRAGATRSGLDALHHRGFLPLLLVGYFEGIDSERGLAYRVSDSLRLRELLGLRLEGADTGSFALSKTHRLVILWTRWTAPQ